MRSRTKTFIRPVALAACLAAGSSCIVLRVGREVGRVRRTPLGEHDLARAADGSYRGATTFMGSDFEVEVTLKGHRIERIVVVKDDGRKYVERAAPILDRVLQAQSLDVDAVSGATVTSRVLLIAIDDALRRALAGASAPAP